jgi:hypothetical protein
MKKSGLEKFVARYNLNGACESIKLESSATGLSTRFASEDLGVVGSISTSNPDVMGLDAGTYCIYDTAKLSSLLRVLDDDITVTVKEYNGTPASFNFKDSVGTKVTAVLAVSEDVIPKVPKPHGLPPMDLAIVVDAHFVSTFTRAKSALNDAETFTVLSDGTTAEIVLGYEKDNNTDRIAIKVAATKNAAIKPVRFNSDYFRSILANNKECEGLLEVSGNGVAHLTYTLPDWQMEYYLNSSRKT